MKKTTSIGKRRFFFLPPPVAVLIACDICAILFAYAAGYCLRAFFPGYLPLDTYVDLLPAVSVFPMLYGLLHIYPGTLLHPAEELRRLSRATSIGFLFLAALFFLSKSADAFSRTFFLGVWLTALFSVPLGRYFIRRLFCRRSWWKTPVILMGSPEALTALKAQLRTTRSLGFAAVAELYPQATAVDASLGNSAYLLTADSDDEQIFAVLAQRHPHALVLMHLPSFTADEQERLLQNMGDYFKEVLTLPSVSWRYCMPESIVHICGSFALSMQRNLANKRRLRTKRLLDLSCTCLFGIVGLPLFLILAALIRMDSPGPALFRQRRLGKDGAYIYVYKFRTMVQNAEDVLNQCLDENPDLAEEWAADHKLRNDPRITRIGNFLRRTSLDELPQLINVVRGEMSLVGPRPIVAEEIEKYGETYTLYSRVPPGITGLWQVSGRNDVSYEERIALDRYYISNWSVWLDLYILIKTIPEVLVRRGGY